MDLRSANTRASWHPLTSLMLFDGGWADRSFMGVPFVTEIWPLSAGCLRPALSTINHELAHFGSAQSTRLGWILGVAAGRALADWHAGRRPTLDPRVESLIGAMTPILEGLALYAEFDLVATSGDPRLPHPIWHVAGMAGLGRGVGIDGVLRHAREGAVFEMERGRCASADPILSDRGHGLCHGLLRLLFLDTQAPERAYYFAGYLWIKAVAAVIARRCPPLGRPEDLLPFLTRLLCDHPALEAATRGSLDAEQLVAEIHGRITGLQPAQLGRLARMIERDDEVAGRFGNWQIHRQLAAGDGMGPIFTSEADWDPYFGPYLDGPLREPIEAARTAAYTHFLDLTTADVIGVELRQDHIHVRARPRGAKASSEPEAFILPDPSGLLAVLGLPHGRSRERIGQMVHFAHTCYAACFQVLQRSVGRTVTFANAVTPELAGSETAFWTAVWTEEPVAGRSFFFLPYTWELLDTEGNLTLTAIDRGGSLSPHARLAFARGVPATGTCARAIHGATQALLSRLAGSPRWRGALAAKRFSGLALDKDYHQALDSWAAVPPIRAEPWRPPPAVTAMVDAAIDLPGFAADDLAPALRAHELLPEYPPT